MNIEELLPFYVLGALSEEEISFVETYLREHPDRRIEVSEMVAATQSLPLAAEPVTPPAHIKQTLLQRIAAEATETIVAQPLDNTSTNQPRQASWPDYIKSLFSNPIFSGASLALAALAIIWGISLFSQLNTGKAQLANLESIVADNNAKIEALTTSNEALQTTNASLEAQLREQDTILAGYENTATMDSQKIADLTASSEALEAQLSEQNAKLASLEDTSSTDTAQIEALVASNETLQTQLREQNDLLAIYTNPDTKSVAVLGTEAQPNAIGRLSAHEDVATFNTSRLATLTPEQTYQLWLINDDGPVAAGTFTVDETGVGELIISLPDALETFAAIGVSIEPLGGSEQPTGDIVLLGSL